MRASLALIALGALAAGVAQPDGRARKRVVRRRDVEEAPVNLVILEGALARPAELRLLPSGSTLVSLEVTIATVDGPAETAPVVYFDAPAWVSSLPDKTAVLIIGRVRRRFFRFGGQTQSRTEVVARRVIRQTSVTTARRALREAGAAVEIAAYELGVPG